MVKRFTFCSDINILLFYKSEAFVVVLPKILGVLFPEYTAVRLMTLPPLQETPLATKTLGELFLNAEFSDENRTAGAF